MTRWFLVKTSDGTRRWQGQNGPDACHRYADAHPGVSVFAWKEETHPIHVGIPTIIEP